MNTFEYFQNKLFTQRTTEIQTGNIYERASIPFRHIYARRNGHKTEVVSVGSSIKVIMKTDIGKLKVIKLRILPGVTTDFKRGLLAEEDQLAQTLLGQKLNQLLLLPIEYGKLSRVYICPETAK
tara:strand:+ start:1423 stop:1794 length:372 start_codon:yes stop_codon:yes gene_type:complete